MPAVHDAQLRVCSHACPTQASLSARHSLFNAQPAWQACVCHGSCPALDAWQCPCNGPCMFRLDHANPLSSLAALQPQHATNRPAHRQRKLHQGQLAARCTSTKRESGEKGAEDVSWCWRGSVRREGGTGTPHTRIGPSSAAALRRRGEPAQHTDNAHSVLSKRLPPPYSLLRPCSLVWLRQFFLGFFHSSRSSPTPPCFVQCSCAGRGGRAYSATITSLVRSWRPGQSRVHAAASAAHLNSDIQHA